MLEAHVSQTPLFCMEGSTVPTAVTGISIVAEYYPSMFLFFVFADHAVYSWLQMRLCSHSYVIPCSPIFTIEL